MLTCQLPHDLFFVACYCCVRVELLVSLCAFKSKGSFSMPPPTSPYLKPVPELRNFGRPLPHHHHHHHVRHASKSGRSWLSISHDYPSWIRSMLSLLCHAAKPSRDLSLSLPCILFHQICQLSPNFRVFLITCPKKSWLPRSHSLVSLQLPSVSWRTVSFVFFFFFCLSMLFFASSSDTTFPLR